jgi:eukaryotic-like serine/threonine-protein kinase
MTPSPGTKLGPYDILAPIGAGAIGEVWKARDTRLGRIVATDLDCSRELYAANREREYHA